MSTGYDTANDDPDIPPEFDRRKKPAPAASESTEVAPSAGARHPLHPLCELFPPMEGAAFEEFAESIKLEGLREPIVLHEGPSSMVATVTMRAS
jgi:hypothetical protein